MITASDGGLLGTWRAHFYSIDANQQAVPREITGVITNGIGAFARCHGNEEANVSAAGWLRDGSELLIVVRVPPHSSWQT